MLRTLAYRNYRLFFGGQVVSLVGTWITTTATNWLVYRLTGSAVLLGVVNFAGQFPAFVLGPFAGIYVDRWDRHRLIVVTQAISMLQSFALAALTLTGRITVEWIIVLSVVQGIVNAFDIPARQAFIVDMGHSDDLINAIALNSSMVNGARVLGPAIAGVTVTAVGEGWCFFANGASYIAVIVGLLLMVVVPREHGPDSASGLERIVEGFRWVAKTAPIRALLLLLGLVSLTGMPYAVLMPIFADKILHGGARGLGMLMGASGIGALAGTLMLAAKREVHGLGRWIAFASFGFGASMILFASSRSYPLSILLLVPVGFSMMLQMSSSNTLIQTMVPDELRGRVMAVYSMMFMGMAPFGALVAGTMANHIGAPTTVALGGLTCLAGSLVFGSQWPNMRGEARQLIVAQGMLSGEPPTEMSSQAVSMGRR